MDRMYWHVPGARSWHADADVGYVEDADAIAATGAACGRFLDNFGNGVLENADRIPPTAHLCGNCARVIAAQTDIEA